MTRADEWVAWVDALPERRARRRLIFQYIVMRHYTYEWLGFERAVAFVRRPEIASLVDAPVQSVGRIREAAAACAKFNWSPSAIRRGA